MNGDRARAAAALALPLAALALAACGGSSNGGSPSAGSATSASATTANGRPDPAKLGACLARQGVKLPPRPAGAGGPTTMRNAPPAGGGPPGARRGFFFDGGPNASPAERAKLQKAFRACGGRTFAGALQQRRPDARSPAFRAALAKYVACVRENGFALPDPNTSGKGPVFDPAKVNQRDPAFVKASAKCQGLLQTPPPSGPTGSAPPP